MSNKTYDILKWIALIALPALATFYITIAGLWNLPYADQISGTIVAIDTLLGAWLGISSSTYVPTAYDDDAEDADDVDELTAEEVEDEVEV